jgi:hypothetical protein
MRIQTFTKAEPFLESIYPALLKDEVKNNLILGAAGQTMQMRMCISTRQ